MSRTPESEAVTDPMSPAEMRFFDRLEWAVPVAFASALSAFRFEQGDVLFRQASAYRPLEDDLPAVGTAIQVLHPSRSARVAPGENDGDRRLTSWQSECRIELVDLAKATSRERTITQGKLLMALWKGDDAWLDPDREEPPLPRNGRELAQHLDQAKSAFASRLAMPRGCRFLFVVDLSSDASRVKAQGVAEGLAAIGPVEAIDLSPHAAGVEEAETFHPALVVRCLAVEGATIEQARAALRKVLYGGASRAEASDPDSAEADRFSVSRHGLLEAIDP
jgi:hypothetical protein